MDPRTAMTFFRPGAVVAELVPLGLGNINDTWRVALTDGSRVVLQRLHPTVFADFDAVMTNLRMVTAHLHRKPVSGVVFFRLLANPQGQDHLLDGEGCCWRLLTHIDHTRTLAILDHPAQAHEIGSLLGRFHLLTADLDPATLADPLPGFHCTPRYLTQYDLISRGKWPGNDQEAFCTDLIEQLRPMADVLEQARDRLSHRVIHGDPKVANFLFAEEADRAVSLIDFDTVRPGLLLHDLGDCLRSCCNPRGEGHPDPTAVVFDPELFTALMAGYVDQAGQLLTPADRELLVTGALVISFELGLRFFTDHLNGDRYFKVSGQGQNLHRALGQFHLHRSIRSQQEELEQRLARLLA
jgi:Ser/Thr protein kinase RdoA (MazF antagonist)